VDVGSPLPADAQAAVLVKPAERALDDPALSPEAGAVLGLLACDLGPDAPLADSPAVVVVVVAAVAHDRLGPPAWPAHPPGHGRYRIEQGHELSDVVAVAARECDGERDAARVGQEIAATGLRTIALVSVDNLPATDDFNPRDLTVLPSALVVFREQVRPEAAETLDYFSRQGVRVVIMSGDNPLTVGAIAAALDLDGPVVNASDCVDDSDLREALEHASIFGRVSPEQKRAAIGFLQESGNTVAMTGDGVNDAMAIKDADLGIAMGTATPATKAVSRIVLLDNRFDRLPNVLGLGRRTIANIERVANIFLAKTSYGILLAVVFAAVALPYPFLPRQLTLVSTLAIGIPSFFLALAPNRRIYRPGVLKRILSYSIPTGLVAGATVLAAYLPLSQWVAVPEARSVATIALFMVSVWILCVLARPLSIPRLGLILGVVMSLVLACTVPFAADFFKIQFTWGGPLLYGVLVGAAGATAIEVVYRFARSRHLVFDRH